VPRSCDDGEVGIGDCNKLHIDNERRTEDDSLRLAAEPSARRN
jgi:hypothetical protein